MAWNRHLSLVVVWSIATWYLAEYDNFTPYLACKSEIWGFITCQNLYFGKYVALTVCLSVCLFVCPSLYKITDNSRILSDIFTKISPQMYLGCSSIAISFQGQRSTVKVTAKVKIRNRCNSDNFWATAKFKKPWCSTPPGQSLWHHAGITSGLKDRLRSKTGNAKLQFLFFVSFQHSSNLIAYLETTCQL